MKFLIDECLSPELTQRAHARGYGESSHVVWLGRAGWKDWELKPLILEGDWTFVTKNSVDFRGPVTDPGSRGQYADVAIHAGLICLIGPPGMDLDMQIELFDQAMDASPMAPAALPARTSPRIPSPISRQPRPALRPVRSRARFLRTRLRQSGRDPCRSRPLATARRATSKSAR